jgi:putative oxidoreductase
MAMIFAEDAGKAVLRVSVAGMLLLHGIHKLLHGIDGIQEMVVHRGLRGLLAYGVLIGEVIAPLFVLVGYRARFAALVMAINMAVAVFLAHPSELFRLGDHGGWAIELPGLYLFGALAICLLGAGRYSLTRGRTQWD